MVGGDGWPGVVPAGAPLKDEFGTVALDGGGWRWQRGDEVDPLGR